MSFTAGFDGKLPSRGDFLSAGLPQGFLQSWRSWMDRSLQASRDQLADQWLPVWLEAPVWFFRLPGGICGPVPVIGLWFPSVDRAGRHYPMTIAAIAESGAGTPAGEAVQLWLRHAQAAGLDALMNDHTPDILRAALANIAAAELAFEEMSLGAWWTQGSRLVASQEFTLPALPDAVRFTAMIAGETSAVISDDGGLF